MYREIALPLMDAMCGGDAEKQHRLAIRMLSIAGHEPLRSMLTALLHTPTIPTTVWGLEFPSRVGLAAGFDKNAEAVLGLQALGWGFIEIGAVLAYPQPGNEKPRLHRLDTHDCIINRYGFNSDGVPAVQERLKRIYPKKIAPIGVNIGLNKNTPEHSAPGAYAWVFEILYNCMDFGVVNVTSPNTPGLRKLQNKDTLKAILSAVITARERHVGLGERYVPVLLKGDPDLTDDLYFETVEVAEETGCDGLINGNTTGQRPEWLLPHYQKLAGGLSGTKALFERAVARIESVRKHGYTKPIIGAGGATPDNVARMFDAGANLVQALTPFIFGGPLYPRRMNIASR